MSTTKTAESGVNEEISKKVVDIVGKQLEIEADKIKLDASFSDDLKADSLAVVELVLAFEEEFELEIPDGDAEQIRTVRDAVSYIGAHVGG